MTGKIHDVIARPRPISLGRRIGHGHGAAQEPRCLPDEPRLTRAAVAFCLRVKHQQVFHDVLSLRYYSLNYCPVCCIPTFLHDGLMFIGMMTDLMCMGNHPASW